MKKDRPAIPPAVNEDEGFGLKHVLLQLEQEARLAGIEPRADNGIPYLRDILPRLDAQWRAHMALIERESPGHFQHTEANADYARAWELLTEIRNHRGKLAANLPELGIALRKVHERYLQTIADKFRRVEEGHKNTFSAMVKAQAQVIAKRLWHEEFRSSGVWASRQWIYDHPDFQGYLAQHEKEHGRPWSMKNILDEWLSAADPRPPDKKRGRKRKTGS